MGDLYLSHIKIKSLPENFERPRLVENTKAEVTGFEVLDLPSGEFKYISLSDYVSNKLKIYGLNDTLESAEFEKYLYSGKLYANYYCVLFSEHNMDDRIGIAWRVSLSCDGSSEIYGYFSERDLTVVNQDKTICLLMDRKYKQFAVYRTGTKIYGNITSGRYRLESTIGELSEPDRLLSTGKGVGKGLVVYPNGLCEVLISQLSKGDKVEIPEGVKSVVINDVTTTVVLDSIKFPSTLEEASIETISAYKNGFSFKPEFYNRVTFKFSDKTLLSVVREFIISIIEYDRDNLAMRAHYNGEHKHHYYGHATTLRSGRCSAGMIKDIAEDIGFKVEFY